MNQQRLWKYLTSPGQEGQVDMRPGGRPPGDFSGGLCGRLGFGANFREETEGLRKVSGGYHLCLDLLEPIRAFLCVLLWGGMGSGVKLGTVWVSLAWTVMGVSR